jgi:hypothetical protein
LKVPILHKIVKSFKTKSASVQLAASQKIYLNLRNFAEEGHDKDIFIMEEGKGKG